MEGREERDIETAGARGSKGSEMKKLVSSEDCSLNHPPASAAQQTLLVDVGPSK